VIVVTGVPGSGKSGLAAALAERLGTVVVSLDAIKEELATEAPDTPHEWLRYDAEAELVRRLEAFEGDAVVDIWIAPRRDTERVRDLFKRWWDDAVEVRCQVPAEVAIARYVARGRDWPPHAVADQETLARIRDAADHPESLGVPRTVVVDTTRPVEIGDVVAAVRRETGARRRVQRRHPVAAAPRSAPARATRLDSLGAVSPHLELLPAVDVAGGQAVQLVQGVAGSEKRFGDPLEAALRWQEAGAEWIHLVDLDAAFGRGHNRELLASIIGRLDVRVELSGGIRDDESLAAAMATGCRRVNIGTAALEEPEWCAAAIATWGDRVAVGLDVRGRTLAARGWTREGGDLYEVLARLDAEGCARYVVTDVNKDGMLQGPNLQLLRDVCAVTDRPVVASGGITEVADLEALAGLVGDGVEGAIIGTALYEGRFTLEEALLRTGATS
jgi:phosphoribosylanthranilate isomerase